MDILEFLFLQTQIIVKAEDNVRSKGLKAYRDKFLPEIAYRISASDYRDQDWMLNIPLWCAGSIEAL